jgi:hypothetical protein
VMVVVPAATPVTTPPELTVAAAVFDELQVTEVRADFDPSLYTPVAETVVVVPTPMLVSVAARVMDVRVGDELPPPPPPQPATSAVTESSSSPAKDLIPNHDLSMRTSELRFMRHIREIVGVIDRDSEPYRGGSSH